MIVLLWRSLARERDAAPFFAAQSIFAMAYLGLAISIFPMVVLPYTIDYGRRLQRQIRRDS